MKVKSCRLFSVAAVLCIPLSYFVSFSQSHQGDKMRSGRVVDFRKEPFGKTAEGEGVDLYTLFNKSGAKVKITNYGGIITELWVPDRNGTLGDVVLGFDSLKEYLDNRPYFGCIVGRYANRIRHGTFSIDGVQYSLARNNHGNHLHGGVKGFNKVVWRAEPVRRKRSVSLKLQYTSKDGEEGYPGNLTVNVLYTLVETNELQIEYSATADQRTVVNLTNHAYFNLSGAGNGDILGHELMINGDRFTPIDSGLIPTGELRTVRGTPMDFTTPGVMGARINENDDQLRLAGGYDHNWVLNKRGEPFSLAARAYDATSGRVLEVLTTEPGIQFYCGNFLDGSNIGKGGKAYQYRYGFCLETQHFPDSPNKPDFPSTLLDPGKMYATKTVYRFSRR